MSYGYGGECLWSHCATEGRKLDILRKNLLVCFEVDCDVAVRDEPLACKKPMRYRGVVGTWRATILEGGENVLQALDVLMAQHYGPGTRGHDEQKLDRITVIKVTIGPLAGKRSGMGERSKGQA